MNDILSDFGEIVVKDVYDDAVRHFINLKNGTTKWGFGKEYTDVIQKLDQEDQLKLLEYVKKTIGTSIFAMLCIFEENENFKIVYESGSKQINLIEISEMLKAEVSKEGGWIDRFSQFGDRRNESS